MSFEEPPVIDLEHETLLPLSHIPDRFPSARQGKRLGRATIYRWIAEGLESVKVGGVHYTSWQALERFSQPRNGRQEVALPLPSAVPDTDNLIAELQKRLGRR
jgi:hypothetical protein